MEKILQITLFILFLFNSNVYSCNTGCSQKSKCSKKESSQPPSSKPLWIILGEADEKEFHIRLHESVNLNDAKALCESKDMSLASIETSAQANFLTNVFKENDVISRNDDGCQKSKRFWTAAENISENPDALSFTIRWADTQEFVSMGVVGFEVGAKIGSSRNMFGAIKLYQNQTRVTLELVKQSQLLEGVLCQKKR